MHSDYRMALFSMTLDEHNYPKPPNFRHFVSLFVIGGDKSFKFGT